MPDPHPLTPQKSGCGVFFAVLAAALLLTVALTTLISWRINTEITNQSRRMADGIAAEFQKAFHFTPEIRVNSAIIIRQDTPILELATFQRQALVRYRWTQTWMHSTKTFEIEALFTARAGFDLSTPFVVRIDPRTRNVGADIPGPKILSLGMGKVKILSDEDGLWNKLTAEDREAAFQALEEKARREFTESNFLAEAMSQTQDRVRNLLIEGSASAMNGEAAD